MFHLVCPRLYLNSLNFQNNEQYSFLVDVEYVLHVYIMKKIASFLSKLF